MKDKLNKIDFIMAVFFGLGCAAILTFFFKYSAKMTAAAERKCGCHCSARVVSVDYIEDINDEDFSKKGN